jgi:uncharacterized damage-inducible protein DinB
VTGGFERDSRAAEGDLEAARSDLLDVVHDMNDHDLERALGGGWRVRRVLEHIIESEWECARLAARLRELPGLPGDMVSGSPSSVAGVVERLRAAREGLLAAVGGVDEESLYRRRAVDGVECSVLSVLEHVAQHDREHTEQVRVILAEG